MVGANDAEVAAVEGDDQVCIEAFGKSYNGGVDATKRKALVRLDQFGNPLPFRG